MNDESNHLLERICQTNNGRYAKLFRACHGVHNVCSNCSYFNKKAKETYRCKVPGSCPAASLSEPVLNHVRNELWPE